MSKTSSKPANDDPWESLEEELFGIPYGKEHSAPSFDKPSTSGEPPAVEVTAFETSTRRTTNLRRPPTRSPPGWRIRPKIWWTTPTNRRKIRSAPKRTLPPRPLNRSTTSGTHSRGGTGPSRFARSKGTPTSARMWRRTRSRTPVRPQNRPANGSVVGGDDPGSGAGETVPEAAEVVAMADGGAGNGEMPHPLPRPRDEVRREESRPARDEGRTAPTRGAAEERRPERGGRSAADAPRSDTSRTESARSDRSGGDGRRRGSEGPRGRSVPAAETDDFGGDDFGAEIPERTPRGFGSCEVVCQASRRRVQRV